MADDDADKSTESDSSTWDFGGEDTQVFDSQFVESPSSSFGNRGNGDTEQLHYIQNTVPFDDTVMCGDDLATQVMDHDGETQVMDLDGETQLVNLCGETQVVDIGDDVMDMFDSVERDETQLFDGYDTEEVVVSDHDGSGKTEIVDDSDEASDDGSGRRECVNSADVERAKDLHQCKEDMKDCKSNTDCERSEKHTSGSIGFKSFTSIRAASMRAAGLAALNKASKRSNTPSHPTLNSEPDIEHRRVLSGESQSHDLEKVNQNRCEFGRSTARKLFDEDTLAETGTKEVNDKIDLGGAANSPVLDSELGQLSYIDSQEPGDASQANALNFVDNFLKVNIECDDGFGIGRSTGGKSKPVSVSSAKGAQTFAKSASLIDAVDKRQAFCWDDNVEDEGGGEFFRKKKEVFFASGSRKLKSSVLSKSSRKLRQSDTKLASGKNKENHKAKKSLGTVIKELTLRKNLIKELDNVSTDKPMPSGTDIRRTIQETADVRFDTQMAAEAMEDLCFGLQETDPDKSQPLPLSNDGVRTTRSKSKMSSDRSKGVTRTKLAAKTRENFDNVAFDGAKRTGKMPRKRRELDSVDAPVSSADQMSVKKQCARTTRQSVKNNEPNKEVNILTGFYPKGKRTSRRLSSTRKEISTQSISRLTRSKATTLTKQGKGSMRERVEQNLSVCTTPVSHGTPLKESSPICMGDEYLKQSCRRPSLMKEVSDLFITNSSFTSPSKETRQRRDVSMIRALFSRHLDGDIIKQQKKILSRLGASESSSMSDATHFIADSFTRTRNMLEAIALGKPIVTHLWLESCGQACCHIDEKKFILRDAKKEKELGFSIPSSLARASQHPLLKGHRVLITPNTKPGKEILSCLVKAVHGMVVERLGRSLLNDDKVPEGLLILSCEEDYAVSLPFLEKGIAIYSSELLLNGIVTQRLEYERHRLFLDHVKRTRSTIWLKKDDNQYKPVGKVK
ncbi:putative BRCT domain-containing protein [Helianthus annuus]|uniref:BRCT domain-containing protein n=2 Tax=Helianthus annuus TaxID=4232 RepID=A0A9K3ELG5_HELAN|nr:uncharacterized protein LOC110899211 isoform X1 [Helianthus annuus]KAF5774139.1 putative BRCT domain-containing protein [Helianthus annuus]KAJ0477532.1 putative BRCT domain-containing protein [Helianthus annuus]KAJ0482023.1 putative BRCT domain-containing protein [Helianthus annuus]KAJ0498364.1 putative BRCT domain-containing protein [Helianthus annuus]KAJ0664374.1 putative BRCT domain-containing protein [Helianthus annuus]